MSRVYVFATKWIDEFLGDNALCEEKVVYNGNNEVQNKVYVKSKCSNNNQIKFVCFDCCNFDKPGRSSDEVAKLINEWKRNLCEEDDEVTFILHDKVLGKLGKHFIYEDIKGVYGFRHDLLERDYIAKLLRYGNHFSVEECESILKSILEIILVLNNVANIKDSIKASSYDIVNGECLSKNTKDTLVKIGISLNEQTSFKDLDKSIERYVKRLIGLQ